MKRNYDNVIFEFIRRNFWGVTYALIALISLIIILLLGIGIFVLLLVVGTLAFIVGNSKDKNISVLQNLKQFVDYVNEKIKKLKL